MGGGRAVAWFRSYDDGEETAHRLYCCNKTRDNKYNKQLLLQYFAFQLRSRPINCVVWGVTSREGGSHAILLLLSLSSFLSLPALPWQQIIWLLQRRLKPIENTSLHWRKRENGTKHYLNMRLRDRTPTTERKINEDGEQDLAWRQPGEDLSWPRCCQPIAQNGANL